MNIYAMYEIDKNGEYTNKEYFCSEIERDERRAIRKRYTYLIDIETLILPKDIWKINDTKSYTKTYVKELVKENKKLNSLLDKVKEAVYKLLNDEETD